MRPHPDGYPRLELFEPRLGAYSPRRSTAALRTAVERIERESGHVGFEARHLEDLPIEMAFELAHTYLGLRRAFPGVRCDFVDFAAVGMPRDVLGYAHWYRNLYPLHHEGLRWGRGYDLDSQRRLRNERRRLVRDRLGPVDLALDGAIQLSDVLGDPQQYGQLEQYWSSTESLSRDGYRVCPATGVSTASYLLCHEFGHLLDAALMRVPRGCSERVYGHISVALLDLDRLPEPTQWQLHLINYPCQLSDPGPAGRGPTRSKMLAKRLRDDIAGRIGRRGLTTREELFADFFAAAMGGGEDPTIARRWEYARCHLRRVGLSC